MAATPASVEAQSGAVVSEFNRFKDKGAGGGDEAVAAVMALVGVVRSSKADTVAGLKAEARAAADALKCPEKPYGALSAACDMFVRYVVNRRPRSDGGDGVAVAKRHLVRRAERFGGICQAARETIAKLCGDFVPDGCTVLVHGYSPVVIDALKLAGASHKRFRVLCTEGMPYGAGIRLASELVAAGVPARVLLDSAVAYAMSEVDVVLVGADIVAETGGVVGAVGTFQVALVARAMSKPVYVAAENYKFARLYPLVQKDIEQGSERAVDFGGVPVPAGVDAAAAARDYTPPQHLELLITDLGVRRDPPALSVIAAKRFFFPSCECVMETLLFLAKHLRHGRVLLHAIH